MLIRSSKFYTAHAVKYEGINKGIDTHVSRLEFLAQNEQEERQLAALLKFADETFAVNNFKDKDEQGKD